METRTVTSGNYTHEIMTAHNFVRTISRVDGFIFKSEHIYYSEEDSPGFVEMVLRQKWLPKKRAKRYPEFYRFAYIGEHVVEFYVENGELSFSVGGSFEVLEWIPKPKLVAIVRWLLKCWEELKTKGLKHVVCEAYKSDGVDRYAIYQRLGFQPLPKAEGMLYYRF